MIKRANKIYVIFILLMPVVLTGCWDYEDIDKKSIVVSVGVDYVGEDVEFAGEIAKIVSQSGERKQEVVYNDVSYGRNFEEARVDFNSKRPYPTFLGATRVVVFGSNYAKKGIEPYLNRINKIYDYRKTVLTVISRESPNDLFKAKVKNDLSVGFLIEDSINYLAEEGSALYTNVGEILSDISLGEIGYLMPFVGIENGSTKYLGIAVMKNSKLIDVIKEENSFGILYILGKNPYLFEEIYDSDKRKNTYSFRIKMNNRKIKTDYIDGKIIINIKMNFSAELRYQYYSQYITDYKLKQLENKLTETVKRKIKDSIKTSQDKYKCDIFGFAKYFRASNPNEYRKMKWSKEYPNAIVNVDVNLNIANKNLSDQNAKVKLGE